MIGFAVGQESEAIQSAPSDKELLPPNSRFAWPNGACGTCTTAFFSLTCKGENAGDGVRETGDEEVFCELLMVYDENRWDPRDSNGDLN